MLLDSATRFYLAIRGDDPKTIRELVEAGQVDVDHRFRSGPGIMLAIEGGQSESFYALLDAGCSVNLADDLGRSPLFLACMHRTHNIIKSLLKHRANPNFSSKENGWTPLHWAVAKRDKAVAELLLAFGADPDISTFCGRTPLSMAIMGRDLEITEFLIRFGANSNIRDRDGCSPFYYAACCIEDSDQRHRILYKMLLAGSNLSLESWAFSKSEDSVIDPETLNWIAAMKTQFTPPSLKLLSRSIVRHRFGNRRISMLAKQRRLSPFLFDYINYCDFEF